MAEGSRSPDIRPGGQPIKREPRHGGEKRPKSSPESRQESKSPESNKFTERMRGLFGLPEYGGIVPPTVPWEVGKRAGERAKQQAEVPFGGEAKTGGLGTEAVVEPKKEKAEVTEELVYEEEIPIGKDIKYKVSVYKRPDGTYVISKLPTTKYDAETVKRIIKAAGIDPKIKLPEKWDTKLSVDEKIEFLKSIGLDTLPEVLNFRPTDWGWRDPNRVGNEPYGTFVSEMEFRDLVLEKWGMLNQQLNAQQQQRAQEVEAEITRRIQSNDPMWILDAHLDLREIREEIRNDPQKQTELDQVLSPQLRQDLEDAKNNLDTHFEQVLQTAGEGSLSDIKTIANQEFLTLQANWRTIDESIRRIRDTAASKKDIPGREGLRVWYAFKQIEKLQDAYVIFKRTEVQVDPLENLVAAEEVMRFFEKSKTREVFGLARERIVRMLQAVENSSDPRVTPQIKERLRKRFNSFEYMNSLLLTADELEGAPDEMWKVAVTFDDETWYYYYDRFVAEELRDRRGERYLVDQNGNLVNLNLQAELENSIAYQYLVDRWRVNKVIEMMHRDLNQNAPLNTDETWLIDRINGKIQNRLAQPNPPPILAGADFNTVWSVDGDYDDQGNWVPDNGDLHEIKMEAIQEWYQERTLLGADGYELGRQRKEIWLDTSIQWHLRRRLQDAGVVDSRINDLLGELQDPNLPYDPITNPIVRAGDYDLMSAVRRNAYDLAKFKLADTLDRLRIYTKSGKAIDTAWGEDTPYIARAITSFAHWCLNEGQGDTRVVRELLAQMDENWSGRDVNPDWEDAGHLLAQNTTAFRFFGMKDATFIRPVVIDENGPLGRRINDLITAERRRTGNPTRDVEGYIWANQIMEGIDPNNPNDVNLELSRVNWETVSKEVKSYPVHDMLFDRQQVWNWYTGEFRNWLNNPFPTEFITMMQKYYSFRKAARGHPGAEFFLELQWKVGQYWKEWYGYDENITTAEFERYTESMRKINLIDEKRTQRLMQKLFGSRISLNKKTIREIAAEVAGQTAGSPGWWGGTTTKFITDVIWPFLKYLVTGK